MTKSKNTKQQRAQRAQQELAGEVITITLDDTEKTSKNKPEVIKALLTRYLGRVDWDGLFIEHPYYLDMFIQDNITTDQFGAFLYVLKLHYSPKITQEDVIEILPDEYKNQLAMIDLCVLEINQFAESSWVKFINKIENIEIAAKENERGWWGNTATFENLEHRFFESPKFEKAKREAQEEVSKPAIIIDVIKRLQKTIKQQEEFESQTKSEEIKMTGIIEETKMTTSINDSKLSGANTGSYTTHIPKIVAGLTALAVSGFDAVTKGELTTGRIVTAAGSTAVAIGAQMLYESTFESKGACIDSGIALAIGGGVGMAGRCIHDLTNPTILVVTDTSESSSATVEQEY